MRTFAIVAGLLVMLFALFFLSWMSFGGHGPYLNQWVEIHRDTTCSPGFHLQKEFGMTNSDGDPVDAARCDVNPAPEQTWVPGTHVERWYETRRYHYHNHREDGYNDSGTVVDD